MLCCVWMKRIWVKKKKRLCDKCDSWPKEPLASCSHSQNCVRSGCLDAITLISCWAGSSPCSSEGKGPFPSPRGGGGGGEEQGRCMDLLSCPRSLYGMQKPCPLPNANSSSGSCRNRVSQGFRGNVRLQPLLNYRVALSNEGEKTNTSPLWLTQET